MTKMNSNDAITDIVCQLENIMSKLGEAHDMLAKTPLSKKKYQPISSLLTSAKVELFKIYCEIKNEKNGV